MPILTPERLFWCSGTRIRAKPLFHWRWVVRVWVRFRAKVRVMVRAKARAKVRV